MIGVVFLSSIFYARFSKVKIRNFSLCQYPKKVEVAAFYIYPFNCKSKNMQLQSKPLFRFHFHWESMLLKAHISSDRTTTINVYLIFFSIFKK